MSSRAPINYTAPAGVSAIRNSSEEILRLYSFGSQLARGAQFSLVAGSIRFVSEDVNSNIFRALSSRAGVEMVGEY